jgi:hypothetical protein
VAAHRPLSRRGQDRLAGRRPRARGGPTCIHGY